MYRILVNAQLGVSEIIKINYIVKNITWLELII